MLGREINEIKKDLAELKEYTVRRLAGIEDGLEKRVKELESELKGIKKQLESLGDAAASSGADQADGSKSKPRNKKNADTTESDSK